MKSRYGLTMLFVSHDLAVVKIVSDRVAVMYLGKLCEVGPVDPVYEAPRHPYTEALLGAIPEYDPDSTKHSRVVLPGEPPSPTDPPSGCRFRTRCPRAEPRCTEEEPLLRPMDDEQSHYVACHFPVSAGSVLERSATRNGELAIDT
jgi:peptide/nickel transport system ATP-binding protein